MSAALGVLGPPVAAMVVAGIFIYPVIAEGVQYTYDTSADLVSQASPLALAPQITGQPQGVIAAPGDIATFSVTLANPSGATYQWLFNNVNIPGATNDSLVLTNVSAASQGTYSVVVTNSAGSTPSNGAFLGWDGNGNGLPDSWEMQYFGNLNQTATGSYLNDGVSNLQEYLDGQNPTVANAYLARLAVSVVGAGTVTVSPDQASYAYGSTVVVTAVPASGNIFSAWSGAASGVASSISVVLTSPTVSLTATFGAPGLPPGIVAWWRAENNALDSIGTNNGTLVGGATYAAGEVGQAFSLNGTNAYVQVPNNSVLDPTTAGTQEAWVYFNQTPSAAGHIMEIIGKGGNDADFDLQAETDNLFHFYVGPGATVKSTTVIQAGVWYHVAGTWDSTVGLNIYVNGVLQGTSTALVTRTPSGEPLEIGNQPYFGPRLFNGRIDEASIYSRALSANQIAGIYSVGSAGKDYNNPFFTTASPLPGAILGTAYSQTINAVLGTAPLTFALAAGNLPPGLSLSSTGVLSGVPTQVGQYSFGVVATDALGYATQQTYSVNVCGSVAADPSIIAWWRAELDAGGAVDSVGGHNGTYYLGTTATTPPVYTTPGYVGRGAFSFNGSSDIRVPNSTALRPAQITAEAWVYPTVLVTGRQAVVASGSSTNTYAAWSLGLNDGYVRFSSDNVGVGSQSIQSPSQIPLNQWTHLAMTFDGQNEIIYVNGEPVVSLAGQGALIYDPTNVPVTIGSDWTNGAAADDFNGYIDEVTLYNRALSGAEIAGIVNAGVAGKAATVYITSSPTLPSPSSATPYSTTFTSVLGTNPVTYALLSGALPPGLTLSAGGVLSGTTLASGTFNFTIKATDANGVTTTQSSSLTIAIPTRPAGLISWWRAEGNTLDEIGGNTGLAQNAVTYAPGEVGQAFHFDGVSAAVEIPNAASLQPSSVTVEAWINLNSTSGTEMIAAKPIGTGGNGSYVLWWSNGALRGAISSSAASESAISATWTPTTGQWYHVAFTFDGPSNLGTLYLDGLAIASGTLNQTIGYDSQPLFLGGYSENGASQGYLNGLLDETSLYDRALTSAEIAQIFAAGSAGKALPGTADADIASGASLQNLLIYGLSLSANAAGANLSPGTVIYPDNSEHLAISFLRDPSRTDITLTVEATSDLQNWTTVATSTGGAPFTGTASISGEVAGTAPRTVTITDPTVPAGTPAKRFMKVTVSR